MNKLYYFLLMPFFAAGQTDSVIEVRTKDLVYSSVTGKIYVTIPSANGANGNSIGVINPMTGILENTYPAGNDPTVLAISDDGQFLYTGFASMPQVRKFDVVTNTFSPAFSLGTDDITGDYYAENIEVMPGNPNTIAVSRRNLNYAPKHEGVAIYDSGVMRPATSKDHSGSNAIKYSESGLLIGFNNETTAYQLNTLTVSPSGVTSSLFPSVSGLPSEIGGPNEFILFNNKAAFTNGKVVDLSSTATLAGTFVGANGPMAYDASHNLVIYLSSDLLGNVVLQHYDAETFEPTAPTITAIPAGGTTSIVFFDIGSYAFNTTDKVYIIHQILGVDQFSAENVSLYPNPVNDILNIHSTQNITAIDIYNNLGQLVKHIDNDGQHNIRISITDLKAGSYFVNIMAQQGKVTKKLLKL